MQNDLNAVLTPPQLEVFCKTFRITPTDLRADFSGWHKHVLLSKDEAFLFPRSPQFEQNLKKELQLYAAFANSPGMPLPKLLKHVKNKEISYYDFGVVTRLNGEVFSKQQKAFSTNELQIFFQKLAKTIAVWHTIPLQEIPLKIERTKIPQQPISLDNWHIFALHPQQTEQAIDFCMELLEHKRRKLKISLNFENQKEKRQQWLNTISEIANLPPVLVHGEVHEGQILIDSPERLNISGVLDWETARIDNPIWDFNFVEWGPELWKKTESFETIRKKMWTTYLRTRGIRLLSPHGLHLFSMLHEFIWLAKKKKHETICITHENLQARLRQHVVSLLKL